MVLWIIFLLYFVHSLPNFGMNKPHYLFHLGNRSPVSLNIGWGYWEHASPLRIKYKNKKDGLYAKMDVHDGQSLFQQTVSDQTCSVESIMRYQLQKEDWEAEIKMENKKEGKDKTWLTYFSVENNDYRYIDHEKYSTYMSLSAKFQSPNHITIENEIVNSKVQKFNIVSSSQLKIFGLTANISQTFNIIDIATEFTHLIELTRDPTITRKTDEKIVKWEDAQLQQIKANDWENKKFVVLFVYGVVGENTKIFITNQTKKTSFNEENFKNKVQIIEKHYSQPSENSQMQSFMKHVIYNLYGGLTFYFGRLYTQNSLVIHRQDYSYTFTPSRLIFPRSFLWDDGFHQMVVVKYNPEIVLDILQGWMRKVDIFGWIGREQIRGSQIGAMMPDSTYVFQDWFEMNPPTLMIPILYLIENEQNLNKEMKQKNFRFLKHNFKKLQQWYRYFKSTQSHQSLEYPQTLNSSVFYRWQCKDDCKKGNFMGSGLDDYPRRENETQVAKQHVDIVSWLYFFSDSLTKISEFLQSHSVKTNKQINYYKNEAKTFKEELYKNFFDKNDYLFKDVVVIGAETYVEKYVHKIGYISLFPFFTGLLRQDSQHKVQRIQAIKKSLSVMLDENLLLAKDGLRSLSLSDELYGTDDNYWRGAVWLPINYLVLRACKLYYWDNEQAKKQVRQLYTQVRQRLITTVHENYKETGYLFENYHEGKGHRGYPFYGWTALIANIISETY